MSQNVSLWPYEEIRKALKPIPDQQELADIARESFIKYCLPHLSDNAADYYRIKYQLAEAPEAGSSTAANTAAAAEGPQSESTSDTALETHKTYLPLVCRFNALVEHISQGIQERQQTISVGLLAAIAGVNVFLYGPPGVAKSLVARRIASAFTGNFFEISLHKYVTVDEVFGPISLHALKNDVYARNSAGFLPQADFAFLDELGKANGAVLSSLLTLLNNSTQAQVVPKSSSGSGSLLKFTLAAANEIPEQAALFDRFTVRLPVEPISSKLSFHQMLLDEPVRDSYQPPKTFAQLLTQLEDFEKGLNAKTPASQLNLEQKVDVVAFFRRLELLETVSAQKHKLNQLVLEEIAAQDELRQLNLTKVSDEKQHQDIPEVDFAVSPLCNHLESLVTQAEENYKIPLAPDWHPTSFTSEDLAVGIPQGELHKKPPTVTKLAKVPEPAKVKKNWFWKSNEQSTYFSSANESVSSSDFKLEYAWDWHNISTEASEVRTEAQNLQLDTKAYKRLVKFDEEFNSNANECWNSKDFNRLYQLLDSLKTPNKQSGKQNQNNNFKDFDEFLGYNLLQWHQLPSLPLAISLEELDYYRTQINEVKISPDTLLTINYCLKLLQRQVRLDVSDRRWHQAITMLKAGAYAAGRNTTIPADVLMLKHILWAQQQKQTTSGTPASSGKDAKASKEEELIHRTILEAISNSMRIRPLPERIPQAWHEQKEKILRYQEDPYLTFQICRHERLEFISLKREKVNVVTTAKNRLSGTERSDMRRTLEKELPKYLLLNLKCYSYNLDFDKLNRLLAKLASTAAIDNSDLVLSKNGANYELAVESNRASFQESIEKLVQQKLQLDVQHLLEPRKEPILVSSEEDLVDRFKVRFFVDSTQQEVTATYVVVTHQLKGKLRPDIPADLRTRWGMQTLGFYLAGLKRVIDFQEEYQYLKLLYRNKFCTRHELNQLMSISKVQATQAEKIISSNLSDLLSFVNLLSSRVHPGFCPWLCFNSHSATAAVISEACEKAKTRNPSLSFSLNKFNNRMCSMVLGR